MAHGHRKLFAAAGTMLAGGSGGTDVLVWTWGILAKWTGVPTMPDSVAVQLISMLSLLAFYLTKEDQIAPNPPKITMSG